MYECKRHGCPKVLCQSIRRCTIHISPLSHSVHKLFPEVEYCLSIAVVSYPSNNSDVLFLKQSIYEFKGMGTGFSLHSVI